MDRRVNELSGRGRRAVSRGGRRNGEGGRPWYIRQPFLLTIASFVFAGWQRVRGRGTARPTA